MDVATLLNGNYHTPEDLAAEQAAGELFKTWNIRSLTNAYEERQPWKYLVEELIPYPSLCAVYGGPGSLKSMILADMAACIASGQRWLEPLEGSQEFAKPGVTFNVEQSPVFWIDFDNGTRRTDERFEAVSRVRNLPPDTPLHYVSMARPPLDISNIAMTTELAKLIKHLKSKLVIIDNLGLITGDAEENSAEMATVMGNLRWLCEETEAAVIIIHHQRKSNGSADKGIRKGETLRGHSSIEASLDMAFLVERKTGEDAITIIPTKVRGYCPHPAFGAYFTYQHREGTHDLLWAKFYSRTSADNAELENITIESVILRLLDREGPFNQKDLVNRVRDFMASRPGGKAPGINKIRGLLKELVDDGSIIGKLSSESSEVLYEYPRGLLQR